MSGGWAVIFDVDGVLLELTAAEEDGFFEVFARRYGITGLSRDWDSYRIRNDEDIVLEILAQHFGLVRAREELSRFRDDYLAVTARLAAPPAVIPGAADLLAALRPHALGIATANFLGAARLRLERAGLWPLVQACAFGADGGGPKRDILARAVAAAGPQRKVIYAGDNLNDLDAGRAHASHFIGFSLDPARREHLRAHGAAFISGGHAETLAIIRSLIARG